VTFRNLMFALILCTTGAACSKAPTAATQVANVPFAQADLKIGSGDEANSGVNVTVNYTGWIYDTGKVDHKGLQFDTSIGTVPLTFNLGAGEVITGFDQGVQGMRVGGLRQMVIPPGLAYGTSRSGRIPPYATLIFEVELVSINVPATSSN
jgi:FKBP-type peptidyl-prolyl cis-trans isomerase FkpA